MSTNFNLIWSYFEVLQRKISQSTPYHQHEEQRPILHSKRPIVLKQRPTNAATCKARGSLPRNRILPALFRWRLQQHEGAMGLHSQRVCGLRQNVFRAAGHDQQVFGATAETQTKYGPPSSPQTSLLPDYPNDSTVLDIGSYSGFSALAWYEGTVETQAEIVTLEIVPAMIDATKRTISKYNLSDRVTLLEGAAQESMQKLKGTFDIIFVDADKEGYEDYVKIALDKKLLAKDGVMLCDNGESGLSLGA